MGNLFPESKFQMICMCLVPLFGNISKYSIMDNFLLIYFS